MLSDFKKTSEFKYGMLLPVRFSETSCAANESSKSVATRGELIWLLEKSILLRAVRQPRLEDLNALVKLVMRLLLMISEISTLNLHNWV